MNAFRAMFLTAAATLGLLGAVAPVQADAPRACCPPKRVVYRVYWRYSPHDTWVMIPHALPDQRAANLWANWLRYRYGVDTFVRAGG